MAKFNIGEENGRMPATLSYNIIIIKILYSIITLLYSFWPFPCCLGTTPLSFTDFILNSIPLKHRLDWGSCT